MIGDATNLIAQSRLTPSKKFLTACRKGEMSRRTTLDILTSFLLAERNNFLRSKNLWESKHEIDFTEVTGIPRGGGSRCEWFYGNSNYSQHKSFQRFLSMNLLLIDCCGINLNNRVRRKFDQFFEHDGQHGSTKAALVIEFKRLMSSTLSQKHFILAKQQRIPDVHIRTKCDEFSSVLSLRFKWWIAGEKTSSRRFLAS